MRKFLIVSCLIALLLPATGQADALFRFERMWPVLHQPWYFDEPSDVAIDDKGFVYIADTEHDRIVKLSRAGQVVNTTGYIATSELLPELGFSPVGVAVDESGTIYVIGEFDEIIKKYDSDLNFLGEINTGSNGAVDVSTEGEIYIADWSDDRVLRLSVTGDVISAWGENGSGPGQFDAPSGIAVDSKGNVFVADGGNSRIQKFSASGDYLTEWVVGDDFFTAVSGIGIAKDDSVYVCDSLQFRIFHYDNDGNSIATISLLNSNDGQCNGSLEVLGTGEDARIYTPTNTGISIFDQQGHVVNYWGSSGDFENNLQLPTGIAFDSESNIYVLNGDKINIFSHQLELINILSFDTGFTDIAISNDILYLTPSRGGLQKFTLEGEFVETLDLDVIDAMLVDGSGNIYIVPEFSSKIIKLDPDGNRLAEYAGPGYFDDIVFDNESNTVFAVAGRDLLRLDTDLNLQTIDYPDITDFLKQEIAIDSSGRLFLAEFEGPVHVFSGNGEFLSTIGGLGVNAGQFSSISDIVFDSDGNFYTLDRGTSRLQKYNPVDFDDNSKAIIVAGGGPFAGNALWDATQLSANFAYRTLTYQGFSKDSIYYLSSDTDLDLDQNGVADDVDADATNANLEYALAEWAADADNLVIYLVDHGGVESFRMSGDEILSAPELAGWVNELQSVIPGKVTLVYDACEAGTFQQALIPPAGTERTVITSTSPGENAVFISQGSVSFSNYFWTHVFNGLSVGDAFSLAGDALRNTTDHQHPMLDVNGDGVSGPSDVTAVRQTYIGNGTDLSASAPTIGDISPAQVLNGSSSATIEATGVTDDEGVARVWAVVRPPDYRQGESGNPVLELPSFDLAPQGNGTWRATWDEFTTPGSYLISIYASDRAGNTSVPRITTVSVQSALSRKAILVTGLDIGEVSGASGHSADLAYDALLQQGYNDDTIYYMSNAGTVGVDVLPTSDNLEFALDTWGVQGTHDLLLYLVGSGADGTFDIAQGDMVTDIKLAAWLDNAAASIPGTITVVMDTDSGGSFIGALSDSNDRIVATSTGAGQQVHFFADGDISYSKFYWRKIFDGATVWDAHLFATRAMRFAAGLQEGQLDDDGDGVPNTKGDGRLARGHRLGAGILLAGDEPLISSLTVSGNSDNPVIEVGDITTTGTIEKVIAVITAPSGAAKTLTLIKDEQGYFIDNIAFTESGIFEVAVYALDAAGNVSLPVTDSFQAVANTSPATQEQTLGAVMTSNGTPTTARFTAGAYLESGNQRSETFSAGDNVVILGTVLPQSEDVGEAADLFVVMVSTTATGSSVTYTDLDGNRMPWNGKPASLQPVREIDALGSREVISIYSGTLEAGVHKVYIGYMLIEGGPIHFNGKAYRIDVE